jgi:hypothetical protein
MARRKTPFVPDLSPLVTTRFPLVPGAAPRAPADFRRFGGAGQVPAFAIAGT